MKVSGNPDVFKEAEGKDQHKKGGRVQARMYGGPVRARLDRPGRKAGGRVGADKAPLSSAHKGVDAGGATPSPKDSYGGTPAD
jgi:hypothetical protein